MSILANNIRYLRNLHEMTRITFGEQFDLSQGVVFGYETERLWPILATLEKIGDKYGLTPLQLTTIDLKYHPDLVTRDQEPASKLVIMAHPKLKQTQSEDAIIAAHQLVIKGLTKRIALLEQELAEKKVELETYIQNREQ